MLWAVTGCCLALCFMMSCQTSGTGDREEPSEKKGTVDKKLNILFILTEDQGPHLSFVGTPGISTPHMDRLAKEGVYFNHAYVNYPVCSPSKASIYTGTYCHTNGMMGVTTNWHGPAHTMPEAIAEHRLTKLNRIRDDLPTLVELLKDAGYTTAVTSKLHVHPVYKFPYDHFIRRNPTYESVREHFEQAGQDGVPLFYLACMSPPHRPFRNSDKVDIGIDEKVVEPPPFLPDTEAFRKDWAEYLGHCQLADQIVGEVLRGLEDSGQKDKTIILFMGDHGPAYHRGKLSLYDFGIHVPLAFSGPGIRSGVVTDELISNVDLMPTLLDLCGLKDITPALQHGHSIAPFLRGETQETGNEYIFADIDHGTYVRDDGEGMQERCIYDGRWKLIYRENRSEPRQVNADLKYFKDPRPNAPYQGNRVYDEILSRREEFPEAFRLLALIDNGVLMPGEALPMFELYDRNEDPWELNNLADDPGHRNTLKRLLAQMQLWSVETDDKYTVLKALSSNTETLMQQLAYLEEQ
jgi:N-sulfoglucosamine sulfohydrolase